MSKDYNTGRDYEIPITLEEYNAATQVTVPKKDISDKKPKYHVGGKSYELDTSDYYRNVLNQCNSGRMVHLVRIQDNGGREITNSRIWGTWEEVDQAAKEWLTALLVTNPTMFLKFTIETPRD